MPRRLLPVVTGLLLVCGASRTLAQSLGDVARKEEERRKRVQPAGKVYTNQDLGPAPPPSAPASAAAADDKAAAAASKPEAAKDSSKDVKDDQTAKDEKSGKDGKDAKPAEDTKGQAYWSSRRRALQEALDRDLTFADALQSRINALSTDFVNRDDPAQRNAIAAERQKAVAELDRVKQETIDHQKAISTIQDEARRAGVPAGWVR